MIQKEEEDKAFAGNASGRQLFGSSGQVRDFLRQQVVSCITFICSFCSTRRLPSLEIAYLE